MNIKKHLVISGKVQGVGFRYWMKQLAINYKISGWVRNKLFGDVEALIIGQEKDIQKLINHCKIGPRYSKVQDIRISDNNEEYLNKDFNIY